MVYENSIADWVKYPGGAINVDNQRIYLTFFGNIKSPRIDG